MCSRTYYCVRSVTPQRSKKRTNSTKLRQQPQRSPGIKDGTSSWLAWLQRLQRRVSKTGSNQSRAQFLWTSFHWMSLERSQVGSRLHDHWTFAVEWGTSSRLLLLDLISCVWNSKTYGKISLISSNCIKFTWHPGKWRCSIDSNMLWEIVIPSPAPSTRQSPSHLFAGCCASKWRERAKARKA